MDDFLSLAAQASPGAVALIAPDGMITYADLNIQVARTCARLYTLGVRGGERAAVLMDRSTKSVKLVHALMRLQTKIVPLNTSLTAVEMSRQIEDSNCSWIFSTLDETPLADAVRFDDLPQARAFERWLSGKLDLDDEFGILFTSGTSGKPKAAVLTWGNIFWSATASAFRLGVLPADRWLLTLPLYHIGGLSIIFRSALYGTTIVLPDFPSDHFDLSRLRSHLLRDNITLVSLVPTMLYRLLDQEPSAMDWPASLRLILLGGAAASQETLARAFEQNLPVATSYGLSEAASQVATALPDLVRRKPGTVGRPLQWSKLQVVDRDGIVQPPFEIGEIQVSGPTLMRGYLNNPEVNARILKNGWLKTGDMGYLDEDGDLWVVQRRTDLIISGGENIYPAEIEAVLNQHQAVQAACVIGISHPEWGQQVAAGVVLRPDKKTAPDDVQMFCRQHLAGFKIPGHIVFFESLPKTASGKINRQELRQWIQQETHP